MIICNINIHEWIKFDYLDDAIIGVNLQTGLTYSMKKIIDVLMRDQGWSFDDAIDWYCFNIEGLLVMKGAPTIIEDLYESCE